MAHHVAFSNSLVEKTPCPSLSTFSLLELGVGTIVATLDGKQRRGAYVCGPTLTRTHGSQGNDATLIGFLSLPVTDALTAVRSHVGHMSHTVTLLIYLELQTSRGEFEFASFIRQVKNLSFALP